jgi:hypothetical protein
MKNHQLHSVIAVCLVISLLGCSVLTSRQTIPITLEDIVQLSHEGETQEAIIAKLKESKTVHPLKADQVIDLQKQGVDSEVIDYMLVAYVQSERRKTRWKDATAVVIGFAVTCLFCHAEKTDHHGQWNEKNAGCTL